MCTEYFSTVMPQYPSLKVKDSLKSREGLGINSRDIILSFQYELYTIQCTTTCTCWNNSYKSVSGSVCISGTHKLYARRQNHSSFKINNRRHILIILACQQKYTVINKPIYKCHVIEYLRHNSAYKSCFYRDTSNIWCWNCVNYV